MNRKIGCGKCLILFTIIIYKSVINDLTFSHGKFILFLHFPLFSDVFSPFLHPARGTWERKMRKMNFPDSNFLSHNRARKEENMKNKFNAVMSPTLLFCWCCISFATYLMLKIWKFCKTLAHSSKQQYPSFDLERAEFLNENLSGRGEIFFLIQSGHKLS